MWKLNLEIDGRPVTLTTLAPTAKVARRQLLQDLRQARRFLQREPSPELYTDTVNPPQPGTLRAAPVSDEMWEQWIRLCQQRRDRCPVADHSGPYAPELEAALLGSVKVVVRCRSLVTEFTETLPLEEAVRRGWLVRVHQRTVWWSSLDG